MVSVGNHILFRSQLLGVESTKLTLDRLSPPSLHWIGAQQQPFPKLTGSLTRRRVNSPIRAEAYSDAPAQHAKFGSEEMAAKSKILVIGATGFVGKYMVEASAKASHPTFALIRESTLSSPAKSQQLDGLKNLGVNFLTGDLNDHDSLVNAVKQVDVVISTVGRHLLLDQKNVIAAIKESGNIKRFIPSEFGNDSDRVHAVDPAKTMYAHKAIIRRAIEAEGIPYTYVSSNFFARYVLPTLAQPGATAPPRDKALIFGDGIPKAIINTEEDVASYTIKAADDPRTLNKIMYIRPAGNIYSFNDLVSLWEKKIGKTLERVYVPEAQIIKKIEGAPVPLNMVMSLGHSGFVKGDHTNFEIDPSIGVEASQLYPEFKYTSVDEFLNQFV